MKTIGNISIVWRKCKGDQRIVIGVIRSNAKGVSFSYKKDGVIQARKNGFTFYGGFSDIDKEYKENVINIFGQRIMRSDRNDVDDFF